MLLGAARVSYSDAKNGIDETRDVTVITPIGDGAVAVNWDQAEPADFTVNDLAKTRAGGCVVRGGSSRRGQGEELCRVAEGLRRLGRAVAVDRAVEEPEHKGASRIPTRANAISASASRPMRAKSAMPPSRRCARSTRRGGRRSRTACGGASRPCRCRANRPPARSWVQPYRSARRSSAPCSAARPSAPPALAGRRRRREA